MKAGGEGAGGGWDGWMASPTQWTWVWVNSRSWWWTGMPDMLQSTGSQRVEHDWATELNWVQKKKKKKDVLTSLVNRRAVKCWGDNNRGWDGWMASPTQWTQIWANSGKWWRTGRPEVLQYMGCKERRLIDGRTIRCWRIQVCEWYKLIFDCLHWPHAENILFIFLMGKDSTFSSLIFSSNL